MKKIIVDSGTDHLCLDEHLGTIVKYFLMADTLSGIMWEEWKQ